MYVENATKQNSSNFSVRESIFRYNLIKILIIQTCYSHVDVAESVSEPVGDHGVLKLGVAEFSAVPHVQSVD